MLVMLDKDLVMARIEKMWGVDKSHPFYFTLPSVVDACVHLNKRGIAIDNVALFSFIRDKKSELKALDIVCSTHTNGALDKIPSPAGLGKYLGVKGARGARQELKLRDEFLSELYTKSKDITRDMHRASNLLDHLQGDKAYPIYSPNAHALGYIRSNQPTLADRVKPKFFKPGKGKRYIRVYAQYNVFYHIGNAKGNELLLDYYNTHLSPIGDFARVLFGKEYSDLSHDEKWEYINWHAGGTLVKPKTRNIRVLQGLLTNTQLSIFESVSNYHVHADRDNRVFNTLLGREIRREVENKYDPSGVAGGYSKFLANSVDFSYFLVSEMYSKYKDEFALMLGDDCYLEIDKDFSYKDLVSDLANLSKEISNKTGWSRVRFVIQDIDTKEKLYAQ